MALLIDKTLLLNTLGYMQLYLNKIQIQTTILTNPKSTSAAITLAEDTINSEILNFNKLVNVLISKGGYTPTAAKFTDQELKTMHVMP